MDAVISLAGREHEPAVVALLGAAQIHRPEAERAGRGPRVAADYATRPSLRLFGIERAGQVEAVAGVEDMGDGSWFLRDIAVAESVRRGGLGRQLLRFLEGSLGATHIEGDTADPATGFYERCGWRLTPTGELPDGRTVYRFRYPSA